MKPELPRHVLHLPGDVEMAFRLIPAGAFRMGSRDYSKTEEPIHLVRIPAPFWLAETPVTQAQFGVWTAAERIHRENEFEDHPEHPAERIDWRQATAYCTWLTRVAGEQIPGWCMACLPTEAEWEYACRAGTNTDYYTGDGEGALAEAGWYYGNSRGSIHPVRLKKPNGFGLFDMHGNVWEWCRDVNDQQAHRKRPEGWHAREWSFQDAGHDAETWDGPTEFIFPAAAPESATHVQRGGSYDMGAWYCRSAVRYWIGPVGPMTRCGFRVCLMRGPASQCGAPETGTEKAGGGAPRQEELPW